MSSSRLFALTWLAMFAFAANSVLCRLALKDTSIDPASFTTIRIISGAIALWLIVRLRRGQARPVAGDWISGLALFVYAGAFSYAYVTLATGTGALLLFGAVQATMILTGLWTGERLSTRQTGGFVLALTGLVALMLPGLSAPPLGGSILMLSAGIAWGVYSLRGRGNTDPASTTTGNFLRAVPIALALSAAALPWMRLDQQGVAYAVLSGAVASGAGYVVWYTALRGLNATHAATVQLSVPVIAALGGVILLSELLTLRLLASSAAILGGIALVVRSRKT